MATIFISLIVLFISLMILDKCTRKKSAWKSNTKGHKGTQINMQINEKMVEYSKDDSRELGFNRTNEGFKRPAELIMKGMSREQEIQYIGELMKDEQYSKAMKSYVPLRTFHAAQYLKDATLNVFIDTVNDTVLTVRDDTAMIDIKVDGGYYNMAGEFVIVNLDKEGGDIKINYILRDKKR